MPTNLPATRKIHDIVFNLCSIHYPSHSDLTCAVLTLHVRQGPPDDDARRQRLQFKLRYEQQQWLAALEHLWDYGNANLQHDIVIILGSRVLVLDNELALELAAALMVFKMEVELSEALERHQPLGNATEVPESRMSGRSPS